MDRNSRERINKVLKTYLDKFESDRYPPWYKRKRAGLIQSISNPNFDRDFGYLLVCSQDSIAINYGKLMGYFIKQYELDSEIVETWIQFAITGEMQLLSPDYQLFPSMLFHDKEETAWPSENPHKHYEIMQAKNNNNTAYVNLQIGRSSTKQDVIWMLNHLWDSEIEPRLMKVSHGKAIRKRPQYFRNSTIYYLHKQGMRNRDIVSYINERFYLLLGDDDESKAVSEENIKKAIGEFKSNMPDWFEKVANQVGKYSKSQLNSRTLHLVFEDKPDSHFLIKSEL